MNTEYGDVGRNKGFPDERSEYGSVVADVNFTLWDAVSTNDGGDTL